MEKSLNLLVFPVKDLAGAKKLYGQLLATEPYAESTYYVGYRIGGLEIGLNPNGHRQGMTGPVGYWETNDIKTSLQSLLDAGGEVAQQVTDVGGGKLVASVRDADGNQIGLMQNP